MFPEHPDPDWEDELPSDIVEPLDDPVENLSIVAETNILLSKLFLDNFFKKNDFTFIRE